MLYKILILLFISTVTFGQFTSDHTGNHIDSVITKVESFINPTLSPSFWIGQGADSTVNVVSKGAFKDTLGLSNIVTPQQYGALADYNSTTKTGTDDASALQSAFDSGSPVDLGSGKYAIDTTIVITISTAIIANGAEIHYLGGDENVLMFNVQPFPIDLVPDSTFDLLTANVPRGTNGVYITPDSISKYASGDIIWMKSNAAFNGSGVDQGEIHSIRKVTAGDGYIQFNEILNDSYATSDSAMIEIAPMITFSIIGNLILESHPADSSKNTLGIKIGWAKYVNITNLTVINAQGNAIRIENCFSPKVTFNTVNSSAPSALGYGLNIAGGTSYGYFTGNSLYAKHAVAISSASFTPSWENTIYNVTGVQSNQTNVNHTFDAHEITGSAYWVNCTAILGRTGGAVGFGLAAKYNYVTDCRVIGNGQGSGITLRANAIIEDLIIKNFETKNVLIAINVGESGSNPVSRFIVDGVTATMDDSLVTTSSYFPVLKSRITVSKEFTIKNFTAYNRSLFWIGDTIPEFFKASDMEMKMSPKTTSFRYMNFLGASGIKDVVLENISIRGGYNLAELNLEEMNSVKVNNCNLDSVYYGGIALGQDNVIDTLDVQMLNNTFRNPQTTLRNAIWIGRHISNDTSFVNIKSLILNGNIFQGYTGFLVDNKKTSSTLDVQFLHNGVNIFGGTQDIVRAKSGMIEILSGGYAEIDYVPAFNNLRIISGDGSPEGIIDADIGTMYLNKTYESATDSLVYFKTSTPSDSTGWKGK